MAVAAKILHLSDLHVSAAETIPGVQPRVRLSEFLAEIVDRRFDVDGCVITGDIAHNGDEAAYRDLRALLNSCPWPIRVLPGNHDQIELGRRMLGEEYWPSDDVWEWRVRDLSLIGMSSIREGFHHGEFNDQSVERLRNFAAEAKASGRQWVVAFHHPPVDVGHWWMDGQSVLRNADAVLSIADENGASAVLCGHLHMNVSVIRGRGTPILVAPSTAHEVVHDDGLHRPLRFRNRSPRALLHTFSSGMGVTSVELTSGGTSWLVDGHRWLDEVDRTNARRPSPH